jgi:hypothetical protein
LVQGGWLKLQELEGLEKDKVSKIKALTLIWASPIKSKIMMEVFSER